jgi:hypothetical protein
MAANEESYTLKYDFGRLTMQFLILIGWALIGFSSFLAYQALIAPDGPSALILGSALGNLFNGILLIGLSFIGRAVIVGTLALQRMDQAVTDALNKEVK